MTRSATFITENSPCDTDYTDAKVKDQESKGEFFCPNMHECQRRSKGENVQCSRKYAQMVASHIAEAKEKGKLKEFMIALRTEKKKFLRFAPSRCRYWVCENGIWILVRGKKRAIEYVFQFARVILNCRDDNLRVPHVNPENVTESH